MAQLELVLCIVLLFSMAGLTLAISRYRSAENIADRRAHYVLFRNATDQWWNTRDTLWDQFQTWLWQRIGLTNVPGDEGLSVSPEPPDWLSLDELPKSMTRGFEPQNGVGDAWLFGVMRGQFARRAIALRPAWTWKGSILSRVAFGEPGERDFELMLGACASTQGYRERRAVRSWFDSAVEGSSGEFQDKLILAD